MKRLLVVGGVIAIAGAVMSGPLAAAPPGLDGGPPPGLMNGASEYTCDGNETLVYGGSGRSAWLDGEVYQALTAEGYENGSLVFTKSWGGGPKSDDTVVCTATEGSFTMTVTAVKVPAGR